MYSETVKRRGAGYVLPGDSGSTVIIRLDRMIQMRYSPFLIPQYWGIEGVD
jgi:hypothetical protein